MKKITKAVFGSDRPSLIAIGLTSVMPMLAFIEEGFRYFRIKGNLK